MPIFDTSTLQARRTRLESTLNGVMAEGEVALFYSGELVQKPGGFDQTYPFLPHPEYQWLTGLRRAKGVVAFSKSTGWMDFVELPTADEALWEGGRDTVTGTDVSQFESWLASGRFTRVFAFGQPSMANRAALAQRKLNEDEETQVRLQEQVNCARRPKDEAEIALIRKMADCAAVGYRELPNVIRPGVTEREIQIAYETAVLRAGSEKFPYDTIVGAGTNAAVLHAVPTMKKVEKGELVLIDAGADLHDYCVDVTRVYPAGEAFDSRQKSLYDLVIKGQAAAIEKCRPGIEWRSAHETAARTMAQGLRELGILKCDAETALESEAIAVFFPHGIGHMVGLRVRDVGGVAGQKVRWCCGVRLRVDLKLEENFVMTVEPGLYFVEALLDRPETRAKFEDQINWSEVEKWRNVGGVRIEDDIQVTSRGPVNLTSQIAK